MKKSITYSIIIVVVIIAAGAIGYYHHKKSASQPAQTTSQTSAQTPQFAAAGQAVSTFPQALIIGKGAALKSSYGMAPTEANANQSTAVYDTGDSIASVYNQFLSYFKNNNYTVFSESQLANSATIYAATGSDVSADDVSVTLGQDGSQTQATVSYLKK